MARPRHMMKKINLCKTGNAIFPNLNEHKLKAPQTKTLRHQ